MKYKRGLLRLTNYNEECQLLIKQSMVVKLSKMLKKVRTAF